MVEEADENESSTRLVDPDPKLWQEKKNNIFFFGGEYFLWVFPLGGYFLWGGISYGYSYNMGSWKLFVFLFFLES